MSGEKQLSGIITIRVNEKVRDDVHRAAQALGFASVSDLTRSLWRVAVEQARMTDSNTQEVMRDG